MPRKNITKKVVKPRKKIVAEVPKEEVPQTPEVETPTIVYRTRYERMHPERRTR